MTLFGMRPLDSEGLCMCISHSRFPLHTPQNSEMVIERIPKGSRSVERDPSGTQLRGTSEKRLHVVTCQWSVRLHGLGLYAVTTQIPAAKRPFCKPGLGTNGNSYARGGIRL